MPSYIKTTKSWKRHLPQRPKKVQRGYYVQKKTVSKKLVIRIVLAIFVILLAQSIFQIKFLKINKIALSGQEDLKQEEVQNYILSELLVDTKYLVFENSNYFLADTEAIRTNLIDKYNLDDAQVSKDFPTSLDITVTEKVSHFIWQKDDSLYLLDAKGRLNRQIGALDEKYLVLTDLRSFRPSGEYIFTEDELNTINKIYLDWDDLLDDKVLLQSITIFDNWDIELHTKLGFYVKIDKDQDIYEQLNVLRAVLEENITGVDIDYIDVRFGDKVYFK